MVTEVLFNGNTTIATSDVLNKNVTVTVIYEQAKAITVYLNGEKINAAAASGNISQTEKFWVGRGFEENNRYFQGTINNILVYNRALSDSEVLSNYNIDNERFKTEVNYVEYIESTGTQYIDTGCIVNKTDSFSIYLEAQFPIETRSDIYMGANGYGQLKISDSYSISNSKSYAVGNKDKITINYENITETLDVNGTTVETKSWSSYNGSNVKIRIT
jgi:hypothetical protein